LRLPAAARIGLSSNVGLKNRRGHLRERAARLRNLRNDDLAAQSEERIQFLARLLK
jgi:hypothetical protein